MKDLPCSPIACIALSENNRINLYKAFCEKRSVEEVRKIYASFTSQKQKDLKLSFEKHAYDINYKPVEATGAARIGGLRENLPCPAQGPGY
jgi:adenylate cyclase